ncbi:MAG: endolytic transglycosylase MltG [Lachnospirales bacterium]
MDKNRKNRIKRGVETFFGVFDNIFNIVFTLAIIFAIYYFTTYYFNVGRMFSTDSVGIDKEYVLTLNKDTPMSDVSKTLEENGIIQSSLYLTIENIMFGTRGYEVKEGEYRLNANMSTNEIMNELYKDNDDLAEEVTITITEGMTLTGIADYLEELEIVDADEFIEIANTGTFDFAFLTDVPERENRLEGYLFPDTYRIYANSTSEQIINKMLVRFEEIYYSSYDELATQKGLTVDQVVTMASIVESEVVIATERNTVSDVIYNRLEANMPLQMCSTVQYALGKRRDVITYEDLEVDSPYNTYKYSGLPIGPISNPGEASIKAVLEPSGSDYLYFVLKDETTGEHFFTSNYDEFLQAKEEYGQIY